MPEWKLLKLVWLRAGLRVDQLQLVAAPLLESCTGLGTDANPIEARRSCDRTVCFDSDLEAASVQSINQLCVYLEKRFAARANYEAISGPGDCGPSPIHSCCQGLGGGEVSSATPVGVGEIRIAEIANGRCAILFPP
jgi:hypothetical protein